MPERVRVAMVSECYVNKAFAELLRRELHKSKVNVKKLIHKPKWGRDRIINEIRGFTKTLDINALILVIDYEEGASRAYISRLCDESKLNLCGSKLHICQFTKRIARRSGIRNIIAIVFDPRPEDFIERVLKEKLPFELLKVLKKREGYFKALEIFEKEKCKEIIRRVASILLDML